MEDLKLGRIYEPTIRSARKLKKINSKKIKGRI